MVISETNGLVPTDVSRFAPVDNFDHAVMADFMRNPAIYWATTDALAPEPELIDFESFMAQPDAWTIAATYDKWIIGYIYVLRKTSVGAEFHCGFHPNFRGKIAKAFCDHTIQRCFKEKGFRKLWTLIPSDNRPAIILARACGFQPEGRLAGAIMRGPSRWYPQAGLRDLVILGQGA